MSRNIGEQGSNGGPRRAYGLQFDDPVKRVSCSSIDEFFRDSDYDQDKVREIQKIHEKARMERIRRKIEDAEEKGKQNEKLEVAKNLLSENIDINVISKSTGLSIDEINNLK